MVLVGACIPLRPDTVTHGAHALMMGTVGRREIVISFMSHANALVWERLNEKSCGHGLCMHKRTEMIMCRRMYVRIKRMEVYVDRCMIYVDMCEDVCVHACMKMMFVYVDVHVYACMSTHRVLDAERVCNVVARPCPFHDLGTGVCVHV